MHHDLAARFKAARHALNAGDSEPFLALMHEDIVWWDTGREEPVVGVDAVAERLEELAAFEIQAELHDVFVNAEHLVALIHATARAAEGRFAYSTAEIYHLAADGRIAKRQAFAHDSSKIERFFSESG